MIHTFILYSMARTGSTTLMELLNCHHEIRCINEPFNPNKFEGRYLSQVTDLSSLNQTLNELWRSFNGIKHVWHASGWPFSGRQFNTHLLAEGSERVLFLNRRNILRRAVSSQISKQTNIWVFGDESAREYVRTFEFKRLDIEWLAWQLKFEMEAIKECKTLLHSYGASYSELWYEDLFERETGWEQGVQRVNEIIGFVGGHAITDEASITKMRELLDPKKSKISTPAIYRKIPGITEIEDQFGSDETGWLFK